VFLCVQYDVYYLLGVAAAFMGSILTALLIATSVVLGLFGASMVIRHVQRKRAFGRMIATVCSSCGKAYGSATLRTMRETGYFWNPAPGYSVVGLQPRPSSCRLASFLNSPVRASEVSRESSEHEKYRPTMRLQTTEDGVSVPYRASWTRRA
jgi:hypothetical protein